MSVNLSAALATNARYTTATLNGSILSFTLGAPAVTLFWGKTNGGTTPGAWEHSQSLGTLGTGAFSLNVSGLDVGKQYFFRARATDSSGDYWSNTPYFNLRYASIHDAFAGDQLWESHVLAPQRQSTNLILTTGKLAAAFRPDEFEFPFAVSAQTTDIGDVPIPHFGCKLANHHLKAVMPPSTDANKRDSRSEYTCTSAGGGLNSYGVDVPIPQSGTGTFISVTPRLIGGVQVSTFPSENWLCVPGRWLVSATIDVHAAVGLVVGYRAVPRKRDLAGAATPFYQESLPTGATEHPVESKTIFLPGHPFWHIEFQVIRPTNQQLYDAGVTAGQTVYEFDFTAQLLTAP